MAGCGGVAFGVPSAKEPSATAKIDLPPLSSAGADREILRGLPAALNGLGTSHPLHRAFSVRWTQQGGEPVFLSSDTALCPTFVPPLEEQDLSFALTADDGILQTRDEVVLRIRRELHLAAPRIAAGPDRMLAYDDPPTPQQQDLATTPAADVTATWEETVAARAPSAPPPDPDAVAPRIFKLTGERGGLASAPDYLLLYPFSSTMMGYQAPVASLAGPQMLTPGEAFALDAGGSADPNGDRVRLRWEEESALPTCLDLGDREQASLSAPAAPQEIAFRVFASDGWLESGPEEVATVVSAGQNQSAPVVSPGADQRTRAGRTVRLDAMGGSPAGTSTGATRTYTWTQTIGQAVALAYAHDGQVAELVAPDVRDTLAFAVHAKVDGIEGPPAVIAVTVVDDTDNRVPAVYLSASSLTPKVGAEVLVSARLLDPEHDPILLVTWKQLEGSRVDLVPVLAPDLATGADAAATFVAPQSLTPLTIEVAACDDHAGCGSAHVSISPIAP